MSIELLGAILFFVLTVFALLFSLTKTSQIDAESFPNRTRFYIGLMVLILSGILAVFMSFPGYAEWFVPAVYPVLKITFLIFFIAGFFMALTTLIAFPQHMNYYRREINGRSDRIALLENIRQIASQPYPITELFTLVLKELGSFLVLQKGAVFMINPSRREMYLVAQIGLDREELSRLERFPMGRDIISQAAMEQEPCISGDLASADSGSRKLILAGRDLTLSAAALPLSSRDRSLGALLVLSDKPYRFEKRDRMLLMAAAEAVAGVVESNRLSRDNQKLAGRLDDVSARLDSFRAGLNEIASGVDHHVILTSTCRRLAEKYSALACRIVKIENGELINIAHHESMADTSLGSQSYRIAVIDAIRRKKMVVLNQEARNREGGVYISRSALLCPFNLKVPGEYAMLLEAPGSGLALDNQFLSEVEIEVNLVTMAMNLYGLKDVESFNQTSVTALLRILKIPPQAAPEEIFRSFQAETERLLAEDSTALVFIRDDDHRYRILDSGHLTVGDLAETVFLPGEGPIGHSAATGETLEFIGREKVAKGWSGLDQVNQDFLNYLGGEKGLPDYQLCIPVSVLDQVVGVVAVFGHGVGPRSEGKEKALVLLAAQLLSIRMSMAELESRPFGEDVTGMGADIGHTINRINNDLATIMGQAELLERQTDVSGQTRLVAGEILKAAEQAAGAVRRLQDGTLPAPLEPRRAADDLTGRLGRFLEGHHVTGNLYMFDNNRTVMMRQDLAETPSRVLPDERLSSIMEEILKYFVTLQEEGDEVLLQTRIAENYFYISLVRGSREKHDAFEPSAHDFGAPDVLPTDIADQPMVKVLGDQKSEVSFDRFGRRPTYLSFRFPLEGRSVETPPVRPGSAVAGLKILAIDDQQMILDLLAGICQSLGLELSAFIDPALGLEAFKNDRFDIVMVDLALGQVSGWEIAREIKHHSPETPVIMMTGWGMNIDPDKAASGGVDFTLAKPFRIEQLTEVIKQAKIKLHSS